MILFRILSLMCVLFCLLAGQDTCAQELVFEGPCDFGTIKESDGPAVRDFRFRNNRRDTLTICEMTTSCRCIIGKPSFRRVPPGDIGSVRIVFDPAYRSGPFSYGVVLWYHDRMASQTITIKGNVVPMLHPIEEDHPYSWGGGLYTSHKVLPFGSMEPGQTKKIFFRYGNGSTDVMDLRFEVEGCCAHTIEMERHLTLDPDERGKLYVSLTMPEDYKGSHVNRIWPVVNGVRLETPILVIMKSITIN